MRVFERLSEIAREKHSRLILVHLPVVESRRPDRRGFRLLLAAEAQRRSLQLVEVGETFDRFSGQDYQKLFLVPTGMALLAVFVLALFFRPPERAPVAVAAA